jgi:hypothetical protein
VPGISGGSGSAGAPDKQSEVRGDIPETMKIPPPLSRAQVDAMTLDEARKQLSEHAMARDNLRRRRADEEAQERLKQEFEWLMVRIRKDD